MGKSFRNNILIQDIFLILIVLAVFGGMLFFHARSGISGSAYKSIEAHSIQARVGIEAVLYPYFDNVRTISENPAFSADIGAEKKQEALDLLKSAYPAYSSITLFDTDGGAIVSTARSFQEILLDEKLLLDSLSGRLVISNVQKKGDGRFAINIISPVELNGNIVAVIAAEFPIDPLWAVADSMSFGESGFVFIMDDSGKVIAHSNKMLILKDDPYSFGIPGALSGGTAETEDFVIGYSRLSEEKYQTGWTVFSVQPRAEALSAASSFEDRFIIIITLSFVLALIVAFFTSKKLTAPVSELHKGLRRILSGEGDYDFSIKTGDEIEGIANYARELTGTMKEKEILVRSKGNLQSKVRELEALNKLLVGREKEIIKLKGVIKNMKKR